MRDGRCRESGRSSEARCVYKCLYVLLIQQFQIVSGLTADGAGKQII